MTNRRAGAGSRFPTRSRASSPAAVRQAPSRGAVLEAAAWLDAALAGRPIPPLLIAVGFGAGHLLDVLDERAPETRVLALEPDRASAGAFLARTDVGRWRESGRLVHLAGPEYAGADAAWRLFPPQPDAHALLIHPTVARNPAGAASALEAVKRIVFGVKANAEARRRFAPRYLTNVIRNVPAIARGCDVRAIDGAYRGIPAVVAGAGPSLDAAIEDLRAAQGRVLLVAVDTALRPLLHAGIAPQLVVGADPSDLNARHFLGLPECRDTWLVAESALDRRAASLFDGRTLWFRLAAHHPWPWLNEMGIDAGRVEMWGSVLTAAFQTACLAGCDPIVLAGADLAFTGGRPYCRGTTYEFDWARSTSRGRTLDEVWAAQLARRQTRRVPDLDGGETVTTTSMQSFRDWMLAAAARSGRRVVNASGAGTLSGAGIDLADLRAILRAAGGSSVPAPGSVRRRPASSMAPAETAARLRSVRGVLDSLGAGAAPISDWAAFTGEGFDAAAVRAALSEAIDAAGDGASDAGAGPWPAAGSPTAARLLPRLPEMLTAFRSALATAPRPADSNAPPDGQTIAAALASSDRQASLDEALALLRHLCDERGSVDALRLAVRRSEIGRVPVSGLYAWPDAIGWTVGLFEALVARAWPAASPVPRLFPARPVRMRDTTAAPEIARVEPSDALNAAQARALLALEWILCACDLEPGVRQGVRTTVTQSIAAAAHHATHRDGVHAGATLTLAVHAPGRGADIDVSVPVAGAPFARLLTGAMGEPDQVSHEILSTAAGDVRVSIGVTPLRPEPRGGAPAIVRTRRPRLVPRVLTDAGVAPALVASQTDEGAVCVLFHRHESVLVRGDGSVQPHHRWPRPIVYELPFGDAGAVAWSDGLAGFPTDVQPGCVMYRHARDGAVEVVDLPVRPTVGRWWQGRLYWNCHPRRVESPTGLYSWAPGDAAPAIELPDLPPTLGMHSSEAGLTFEPGGGPLQGGGWQRRFTRQGWTWRPGSDPQAIDLGPYGAASARVTSGAWTAHAHLESDLVRLHSAGGRVLSMTCYYPYGLAWLGDSLLVGTIDQDLLLFDGFARCLHDLSD